MISYLFKIAQFEYDVTFLTLNDGSIKKLSSLGSIVKSESIIFRNRRPTTTMVIIIIFFKFLWLINGIIFGKMRPDRYWLHGDFFKLLYEFMKISTEVVI